MIEKIQAIHKIWKWKTLNDGDYEPDWENYSQEKFRITYSIREEDFFVACSKSHATNPFLPYFSSEEI
jgi:hypothetical protein